MKPISSRAIFAVNPLIFLAAALISLAGCSSAQPVKLAPIPSPAAVIVHVPTYVALPIDATEPCPKPQPRPIRTDVDLLRAAQAFAVQAQCNANKLAAIRGIQP
jgi:hypothetical protein